jgi:hypothetical protein
MSVACHWRGRFDRVTRTRDLLDADEVTRGWLGHLAEVGAPDFAVILPGPEELAATLVELAVPHEDVDELVALLGPLRRDPQLWWVLERSVHALVRTMGEVDAPVQLPPLPADLGDLHRWLYVYVFVAALPHVRDYHRARGIPGEVSRLTLADLGRNVAVHRQRYGVGGLNPAGWLTRHFRGGIYHLGRLQFERATLGTRTGQAVRAAGQPYGPGDPALGVHIPRFYGPMTATACDDSFAWAREFFPRHFPEERYAVATCHSWLLDGQLAEYLPAQANIVRFLRRFQPAYRTEDDEAIQTFVFGQTVSTMDSPPQRTTLERAIVGHLAAGRHWHVAAGWLPL